MKLFRLGNGGGYRLTSPEGVRARCFTAPLRPETEDESPPSPPAEPGEQPYAHLRCLGNIGVAEVEAVRVGSGARS